MLLNEISKAALGQLFAQAESITLTKAEREMCGVCQKTAKHITHINCPSIKYTAVEEMFLSVIKVAMQQH